MYFNPAMASGHTLGCGTTRYWEHFTVYWLGPFVGCFLAVMLDRIVHVDRAAQSSPPPLSADAGKKKKD
jgi:hypothetical protein